MRKSDWWHSLSWHLSRTSRLLPIDTAPVDFHDLVVNLILVAEVMNRGPAGFDSTIIVDDKKATNRQLVIKAGQSIHRRFVHITVESQYCQLLNGSCRECVFKPPHQKPNQIATYGQLCFDGTTDSIHSLRNDLQTNSPAIYLDMKLQMYHGFGKQRIGHYLIIDY